MTQISEKLLGIVQRVTYHNPASGWSVLKVQAWNSPGEQHTVTVHQTRVFAGATLEFSGAWTMHPQYGRQFRATQAIERKPASAAALEKYLGSGLIKGVGPKTAGKIVKHFGADTLQVFEDRIELLVEVPGIAKKKLAMISEAWREHRLIRDVMIFLQGHGISTLFAVRIYQKYGERAIELVNRDPYRLAADFYGIGFFSADRVALSIGLAIDSEERLTAAIRHVLSASREQGHCYLTGIQIRSQVEDLLALELGERLGDLLVRMEENHQLKVRMLFCSEAGERQRCYYAKSLYFEEEAVAEHLCAMRGQIPADRHRIARWVQDHCRSMGLNLSSEQMEAVGQVVLYRFSVLTGGPGCGKTTTTQVIVRLLESMNRRVLLAAPTGRAAQRMGEVIGREARTLHRLLEWQGGGFLRSVENPLVADYLIIDECSMLDISLTAALLAAVPEGCQLLFIGDADQLPSVGAGNVLRDIIASGVVPCFRLTQVFRQASQSKIIGFAHQINRGETPYIDSPFKHPNIWQDGTDCIFVDSDQPTREQLDFIGRVKRFFNYQVEQLEGLAHGETPYAFRTREPLRSAYEQEFVVPSKFHHVDLQNVAMARGEVEELKTVLKKIHPWSTLHYNLTALEALVKLYLEWIPKYRGRESEIQILSPMTRGTLGTANLNRVIQQAANPPAENKGQLVVGERIFREGDRVIHRRNNYTLEVFNGDIGRIRHIDTVNLTLVVVFFPGGRQVLYHQEDIVELDLAYAITIHKSQGSEFKVVILPVLTQHFMMLYRNLIYTGLTRARELAVFVGTRRALAMAVHQQDTARRQTALAALLRGEA